MGRKKLPASIKKGRTLSKAEVQRRDELERALRGNDDKITEIPDYLTEEEKIYYKWLVEELESTGLISNIDQPLIELTANTLYIMHQADEDIRKNGLMINSFDKYGNEKMIANPCLKIKLDFTSKFTTLCNQLPLSPSSRASLAARKVDEAQESADPVLRLLQGNA